jgi:hypothetical protein
MNLAGVDWQLIMYGGAQHGFTHSHAIPGAIPGVEYNAHADHRSFAAASTFLAEAFGDPPPPSARGEPLPGGATDAAPLPVS